MINLLQQSPVDHELADVLLTFPGLVRLLEFKMTKADKRKEQDRHRRLSIALENENQDLIDTSRSVHWYVEVSSTPEAPASITRLVPYLDAFSQVSVGLARLEDFIDHTARQAIGEAPPQMHASAKSYLDIVRLTFANKQVEAGGLLIVVDGQGGGMHFAQLRDITDLQLPYKEWLERSLQEHTFERPSKALELDRQHEISKPSYHHGGMSR